MFFTKCKIHVVILTQRLLTAPLGMCTPVYTSSRLQLWPLSECANSDLALPHISGEPNMASVSSSQWTAPPWRNSPRCLATWGKPRWPTSSLAVPLPHRVDVATGSPMIPSFCLQAHVLTVLSTRCARDCFSSCQRIALVTYRWAFGCHCSRSTRQRHHMDSVCNRAGRSNRRCITTH